MTPQDFEQWLRNDRRPPLVMGVLNVTPDSFSDGGRFLDPGAAEEAAYRMCAAGAAIIDVGGESTRPGSQRVIATEQIGRILPILKRIGGKFPAVVSIDTTLAEVARAAVDEGAQIINDISAGRDDPAILKLAAERQLSLILMHMRGEPATMQAEPRYDDVVKEVSEFLSGRGAEAQRAGVERHRILIDPGIGFGKTVEHNLALLRQLPTICRLGWPVVVGTSRKGFLGKLTGEDQPRLFSTAASVAWSIANGAAIVRVHDVEPMARVVRIIRAIQVGEP